MADSEAGDGGDAPMAHDPAPSSHALGGVVDSGNGSEARTEAAPVLSWHQTEDSEVPRSGSSYSATASPPDAAYAEWMAPSSEQQNNEYREAYTFSHNGAASAYGYHHSHFGTVGSGSQSDFGAASGPWPSSSHNTAVPYTATYGTQGSSALGSSALPPRPTHNDRRHSSYGRSRRDSTSRQAARHPPNTHTAPGLYGYQQSGGWNTQGAWPATHGPGFFSAASTHQPWNPSGGGVAQGSTEVDLDQLAEAAYAEGAPAYPANNSYGPPHQSRYGSCVPRDGSLTSRHGHVYAVHKAHMFSVGKVLEIDWAEPRGESSGTTVVSVPGISVGNVFRKKRRFIVYRNIRGHSSCLPIVSYGERACTKPGCEPQHHGIVHTGREPAPLPNEPPLGFPAIEMVPINEMETLKPVSRVNYLKQYPIEHNYLVRFVGEIKPDHMQTIIELLRY